MKLSQKERIGMKKISEDEQNKPSFLDTPQSELDSGRIVQCPHCNGYGSSFKDPKDVNKCTLCGGGGLVPDYLAERYEKLFDNQKMWNKDICRYYLDNSSIFDNPSNVYDFGLFATTIKDAGGRDIKPENAYGWNNQPEVVTFLADGKTLPKIKKALDSLDVFKKWGCIIREKDWE